MLPSTPLHHLLLDAFGGLEDLLAQTRAAWRDLQGAKAALAEAEEAVEALRGEEDFLSGRRRSNYVYGRFIFLEILFDQNTATDRY